MTDEICLFSSSRHQILQPHRTGCPGDRGESDSQFEANITFTSKQLLIVTFMK